MNFLPSLLACVAQADQTLRDRRDILTESSMCTFSAGELMALTCTPPHHRRPARGAPPRIARTFHLHKKCSTLTGLKRAVAFFSLQTSPPPGPPPNTGKRAAYVRMHVPASVLPVARAFGVGARARLLERQSGPAESSASAVLVWSGWPQAQQPLHRARTSPAFLVLRRMRTRAPAIATSHA